MFEFVMYSVGLVFIGFMLGTLKKDCELLKLCRSQSERGDYWFDRYMMEVRDDWKPLTKDFDGADQ